MATATTARSLALAAPTGTTIRGTRTGTLACGAPVTTLSLKTAATATALTADYIFVVSPIDRLRRIHCEVQRSASKFTESRADMLMGKKHKHIFDKIITPDNFWLAYKKAAKGKRTSLGYLRFRQEEAANIAQLLASVSDGSYQPSPPRQFMVFEPKQRQISALSFADRLVQHALCNVIEPIFDAAFMPQSFACRKSKGTHRAAINVQSALRKIIKNGGNPVVLKTDFSKYFHSINLATLNREIRRKVSCVHTLELIGKFIPRTGIGIPIGNLTSQLAANIYGNMLDRWLAHDMRISRFTRYMDDVVVVGHSVAAMQLLQVRMEMFAAARMGLSFSHWSVQSHRRGVNFCGYRIWATHKLLRKSSVRRAKQKIRERCKTDHPEYCRKFLAAWLGHAKWADSKNLITYLEGNRRGYY